MENSTVYEIASETTTSDDTIYNATTDEPTFYQSTS